MQITNYIHAYENTTLFDLHFNMYIVKMTNINNKLIIHIVNMLIKKSVTMFLFQFTHIIINIYLSQKHLCNLKPKRNNAQRYCNILSPWH
jgi:hypothetical protein